MSKAILGVWPNLSVEIEGDSLAILRELAFWDNVPHECPVKMSEDEICGAALHVSYRTPTAKKGPKKGQTFEYFGLICAGNPSHECQISERADKSGCFIRTGNRQDGAPNWRLAYHVHDDEPEEQSGSTRRSTAPTSAGEIGQAGFLNESQHKELVRVGANAGMDEAKLNQHCIDINGCPLNELPAPDVVEYRKTLMAI